MTTRPPLKRRVVAAAARTVNRAGFEITRDRFRHRFVHGLQAQGVTTVLDIGANRGQFGAALRRARYAGRIVSVEPLGDAYARLVEASGADPQWTAERAAVSDRPGEITINVSDNLVSSSVLPILERSVAAAPSTRYVRSEQVPATTVDDLVARHGIVPEQALLKIDVQGYEIAVLDGAADTLEHFAAVRTEMSLVALYEGQTLLPDMIEYLGKRGFELWDIEPGFVEPGTRRLLQVDGVFFRRM